MAEHDLRDLVNARTIAARLGVTTAAVAMWRSRDMGFPQALDTPGVGGVPLFSWEQVSAWQAERVRSGTYTAEAKRQRMAHARQFRH